MRSVQIAYSYFSVDLRGKNGIIFLYGKRKNNMKESMKIRKDIPLGVGWKLQDNQMFDSGGRSLGRYDKHSNKTYKTCNHRLSSLEQEINNTTLWGNW